MAENVGLNRELQTYVDLFNLPNSELGYLLAFVTEDDPHSPVMLPKYDELVEYLDGQVPIVLFDARQFLDSELERFRVYSVPTLIWWQPSFPEHEQPGTYRDLFHMRIVGTVEEKKLRAEADLVVEKLLPD
jgi:hypothetical protein